MPSLNANKFARINDRALPIFCYSHLRWNFVFQRPQQLMTRAAQHFPVFYVEEPIFEARVEPFIEERVEPSGVVVLIPHGPQQCSNEWQSCLLASYRRSQAIDVHLQWFYTPMALPIAAPDAEVLLTIYDCMDELSAFRGAPVEMQDQERALMGRADVVLTGGRSLYNAKRGLHPHVYELPSSVEIHHFGTARNGLADPGDQLPIPKPRIGFFGVIDERFDTGLLAATAAMNPNWQFVMIGPTAKIDPRELPVATNIHFLGAKLYDELPSYLAHWDVAMMPFALNAATRYISPTKTPEYLAGGRPVVSSAIEDVVAAYGKSEVVQIFESHDAIGFSNAISRCLTQLADPSAVMHKADLALAGRSWEATFGQVLQIISACLGSNDSSDSSQVDRAATHQFEEVDA